MRSSVRVSRSRELAATAIAQREFDPRRSLLLALEALDVRRTSQAEAALRRWFFSPLRAVVRVEVNQGIEVGAISPDGRLFVASGTETAVVARTVGGARVAALRGVRDPTRIVFSPDGTLIASTPWVDPGAANSAQIWRAATGKRLAVLEGHRGAFRTIAFSPDGELVVAAGARGPARLWRSRTARRLLVCRATTAELAMPASTPTARAGRHRRRERDGTGLAHRSRRTTGHAERSCRPRQRCFVQR